MILTCLFQQSLTYNKINVWKKDRWTAAKYWTTAWLKQISPLLSTLLNQSTGAYVLLYYHTFLFYKGGRFNRQGKELAFYISYTW